MNCKHVEPLLSLYVGRDLAHEHSRLVAAHLQYCTECARVADEYAAASQLLQQYESPFFSDDIYAGIRTQVLHEIERTSHAPGWATVFSRLFLPLGQPRMRWITAALLLAISVIALYLSRNSSYELPKDQQVAVQTVKVNQIGSGADVRSANNNKLAGPSSFPSKGSVRTAIKLRSTSRKRDASVDVAERVIRVWQPSSARAPLRVEMQTNDRNIRIIWLSGPSPGADGNDGSKGI